RPPGPIGEEDRPFPTDHNNAHAQPVQEQLEKAHPALERSQVPLPFRTTAEGVDEVDGALGKSGHGRNPSPCRIDNRQEDAPALAARSRMLV
ncbi:MAG TPA: hypothetical protein VKS60_00630, partial [Stellaceae bacterium]|nr:hypothetical protein [Stellaceae bacterium]